MIKLLKQNNNKNYVTFEFKCENNNNNNKIEK